MAYNLELLNIYKKDDFNKDIVSTSHYLRILVSVQGILIRILVPRKLNCGSSI